MGQRKTQHNERCHKCKETIKAMLKKIYGNVETNHKFEIGVYPEDYKNTPYYKNLKEIYEVLQNYRGFREFVKSQTLPNCDYFIPDPGIVIEFDESQHFTLARKIALEHYPEELKLGFDREKWVSQCERLNKKDNDPPYRDEQRAWYDTLRDFLPVLKGIKPTIRLYASDFVWCDLDPDNPLDVKKFENLLKGTSEGWEIEVIKEKNPSIARVIIAGKWEGNQIKAKQLLEDICDKWPKGKKVRFLITCGGFIEYDWPESISKKEVGDNKDPNKDAVEFLVTEAKKCVNDMLNSGLNEKLKEFTDYITLGIDSHCRNNKLHIELVLLIDLKNNRLIQWTGKSYPVFSQQDGLVRMANIETHFVKQIEDEGNIMLLGCHDLQIFSPRHYKRENMTDWRKNIIREFHKVAKDQKPTLVLQHPHSTVKIKTWKNAWIYLNKEIGSVKKYASAGKFYEPQFTKYDDLESFNTLEI